VIPDQPDDPYELAPQPEAPARRPPRPAPAPRTPQPLDYRAPRPPGDRGPTPLDYRPPAPLDDSEKLRNLYMPVGILAAGLIIELFAAYFRSPTMRAASVDMMLTLVVRTVIMMVAMLIAARVRQIDLGSLPLALLKLAAVAVGPSAVLVLLWPVFAVIPSGCYVIPVGLLVELAIFIGLIYTLLGAFFDLDESDTWYCVMVMFIVWVAAYFGLSALAMYV